MANPAMSSFDSVKGPSITVIFPSVERTRAPPFDAGSSPPVNSTSPDFMAFSTSLLISAMNSGVGGTLAVFGSGVHMDRNFIAFSVVIGTCETFRGWMPAEHSLTGCNHRPKSVVAQEESSPEKRGDVNREEDVSEQWIADAHMRGDGTAEEASEQNCAGNRGARNQEHDEADELESSYSNRDVYRIAEPRQAIPHRSDHQQLDHAIPQEKQNGDGDENASGAESLAGRSCCGCSGVHCFLLVRCRRTCAHLHVERASPKSTRGGIGAAAAIVPRQRRARGNDRRLRSERSHPARTAGESRSRIPGHRRKGRGSASPTRRPPLSTSPG